MRHGRSRSQWLDSATDAPVFSLAARPPRCGGRRPCSRRSRGSGSRWSRVRRSGRACGRPADGAERLRRHGDRDDRRRLPRHVPCRGDLEGNEHRRPHRHDGLVRGSAGATAGGGPGQVGTRYLVFPSIDSDGNLLDRACSPTSVYQPPSTPFAPPTAHAPQGPPDLRRARRRAHRGVFLVIVVFGTLGAFFLWRMGRVGDRTASRRAAGALTRHGTIRACRPGSAPSSAFRRCYGGSSSTRGALAGRSTATSSSRWPAGSSASS